MPDLKALLAEYLDNAEACRQAQALFCELLEPLSNQIATCIELNDAPAAIRLLAGLKDVMLAFCNNARCSKEHEVALIRVLLAAISRLPSIGESDDKLIARAVDAWVASRIAYMERDL